MENIGGDDIDKLLEDGLTKSEQKRSRSKNRRRSRSRNRRRRRKRSASKSFSPDEEYRRNRHKRDVMYRDDCTIFVCHIHPAVDDRDVFDFFSQCGEVRDVVLMRDNESGTSKGYCYVEFDDKESVVSALTINGQYLGGSPIMVSVSNAEKNRVANSISASNSTEGPFKLYVSNIDGSISADDLEPIFGAFGVIEAIYVDKKADPVSGTKSGFVEFRTYSEATFALTNLNNMSLLNKNLRVSQINMTGGANAVGAHIPGLNPNLLDEGQGGLQMDAHSRVMLMQRLQASATTTDSNSFSSGNASVAVPKKINSRYVLLKNMFDPDKETEENWDIDIQIDVKNECSKFGAVENCIVDKNSLGHVYLTFKDVTGAKAAINQLNGRWFSQKQIAADMLEFEVFQRMCPKTAN